METRYFFEHFENGKWIDFDGAKLTTNYEIAFSQPTNERAEQWLIPLPKDTKEVADKFGFGALFMQGLKDELSKKGISLYQEFVIIPYTESDIKKRKIKTIDIEFSNGVKMQIVHMNGKVFGWLQEKYKSAIVKIDGQPSAFWGMTDDEIEKELKRIGVKKNDRNEAIKKYQANCKHDKGYVTNTGMSASKCVICGKPMF